LLRTGDIERASEAIRRACYLDPESWRVSSSAMEVWCSEGSQAELRTLIKSVLQRFPERWTAWAQAGWAYVAGLGEADTACVVSAHGPRLQPQLASAWFQHSNVLARGSRHEESITAALVGWRWLPPDEDGSQSVPAAVGLAESYWIINDKRRAQAWLDEGARRLPTLIAVNPAEAYFWQGKLLESSGDQIGARQAFKKSVDQNLLHPKRQDAEAAMFRLAPPLSKCAGAFSAD